MHRTDAANHVSNKFDDGDPGVPRLATIVGAAWLNDVQENIIEVIEEAGTGLTKGEGTDLYNAILQIIADAQIVYEALGAVSAHEALGDPHSQYLTAAEANALYSVLAHTHSNATTSVKGLAELATNAETQAGTDTVRSVTPASLASFAKSHATSGYQKLPGGLILQWGQTSLSSGVATITFPIAFASAVYSAVTGDYATSIAGTRYHGFNFGTASTTQITIYGNISEGETVRWFAVGK
ncbi:MAG: hypothetical protein GKR93_11860 [Gammaproteobacteria bacterium]|nr:hypothetical protein [Gammaproteobacteria bacterium]